jgi:alpha-tubulin suppressor-like RCC1 family protein
MARLRPPTCSAVVLCVAIVACTSPLPQRRGVCARSSSSVRGAPPARLLLKAGIARPSRDTLDGHLQHPEALWQHSGIRMLLRGGSGGGREGDAEGLLEGGGEVGELEEDSTAGGERWFAHISAQQPGAAAESHSERGEAKTAADARVPGAPVLRGDGGGVVSWGIGLQGRLGSGDWIDRFEPCRALEALCGELTQISAGDYHALALCRNGSVLAFGSNGRCQLGDGSKIHSSSAQMVADLDEGFVKVAAGGLHSLALHSEGFVLAWGDNSSGQVGQSICPFENDAEIRHRGWPVQVATPVIPRFLDQNVVDIAAGFFHSLALLADGRILAWGQNIFGQLGTGKNLTWPPYDADEDDDLESRSDAFKRTHSQKSAYRAFT